MLRNDAVEKRRRTSFLSRIITANIFYFIGGGVVVGFSPMLFPVIAAAIVAGGVAGNVFTLAVLGVIAAAIAAALVGGMIGYGIGSLMGFIINQLREPGPTPPVNVNRPNPVPNHAPSAHVPNTHVNSSHANLSRSFGAGQQPQVAPVQPVVVQAPVVAPQVVKPQPIPQVMPAQDNHPECFVCPLTGELMTDPYINVTDGMTYEKAQLETHITPDQFKENYKPNLMMKGAIEQYVKDGHKITEGLLGCFEDPITISTIEKPFFCSLDNQTYDKDGDILLALEQSQCSPMTREKVELNAGETIEGKYLSTPNYAAQNAIEYIRQKLAPANAPSL